MLAALLLESRAHEAGEPAIFEEETGRQVDFDLRGSLHDVMGRIAEGDAARVVGRPRLGVVGREITLLPRHWEWLAGQPKGASAVLRGLIEAAMKGRSADESERSAVDATYRVMSAVAGDLPGFEEAARALYARNWGAFRALVCGWPEGVRGYFLERAEAVERQGDSPR